VFVFCACPLLYPHLTQYFCCFLFFTDSSTTEIYTLSLHDALPILEAAGPLGNVDQHVRRITGDLVLRQGRLHHLETLVDAVVPEDRKSTRLNSSHVKISYAVFCLKKKKN